MAVTLPGSKAHQRVGISLDYTVGRSEVWAVCCSTFHIQRLLHNINHYFVDEGDYWGPFIVLAHVSKPFRLGIVMSNSDSHSGAKLLYQRRYFPNSNKGLLSRWHAIPISSS